MEAMMEVARGYKTELDPNNVQASQFQRLAEVRRLVFNVARREWKCDYEAGGKPSAYALKKKFNAIKDIQFPGVRDAPYAVTEAAFKDLGAAFKNFFRRIKNGEKPGYPKPKFRADKFAVRGTKIETGRVRITGVGWVRLKEQGYIPTTESGAKFGTYARITKRAGRWFISVTVYEDVDVPDNGHGDVIGVDLGIKHLIVCSDGTTFDRSRALEQAGRKVGRLNKELARRKKGGKNWNKTKHKLQKAYWRLSNVRKHWLNQVSNYLTKERRPSVIVLEDLNVKGMMSNHHLANALSEASFGELRRQIEYKAEPLGIDVVVVDRWYPSSKTCSRCGCIKDDLTLSDRVYRCAECGLEIDRDLNAARNLAALGNAQTERDCSGS